MASMIRFAAASRNAEAMHMTAISPPIDLTGATSALATWWAWLDIQYWYDGLNLQISTDGGTTWQIVYSPTPDYFCGAGGESSWCGSPGAWSPYTADLTPYVGHVVLLRFSFYSDSYWNYAGAYIDDVRVY